MLGVHGLHLVTPNQKILQGCLVFGLHLHEHDRAAHPAMCLGSALWSWRRSA